MKTRELYYRRVDDFPTNFNTQGSGDSTSFEVVDRDGARVTSDICN